MTRDGDPFVGQAVYGGFVIERKLGEGGMGAVYAAIDRDLDKRIAVKVLLPHHSANAEVVTRFIGEAKAASRIGHDNIVRIEAKGTLPGGCAYVAMEYLDGVGLDTYLDAHPRLPCEQALAILVQVGAALDAAHARGIVHRDIKPPNIFITSKPDVPLWVKVLDFGIARFLDPHQAAGVATREGVVIGTPEFMPPEQAIGAAGIDHRADIYALGVVAHRMVTGCLPQRAANGVDWRSPGELVEIPQGWCDAIQWALQFHPSARPARVADWIGALVATTPNGGAIATTYASGLASGERAVVPLPASAATMHARSPTTLGSAVGAVAAPSSRRRQPARYVLVAAATAGLAFAIPILARERTGEVAAPPSRDARAVIDGPSDAPADARADAATDAATDAVTDAPTDAPGRSAPPDAKRRRPPAPRPQPDDPPRGVIPAATDDIVE